MKIVRHAKYVGTMIGLDGYIHPWTHPEKFFQRVLKIFASTKSLVERLCDLKIYAISVLDFIGMRIRQGNPQGREPSWCWALCVVLVLSCEWIHSSALRLVIFEIETTALVHVACAPQESGVLLTDFAASYPSVNHTWIFSVIENTGLLAFLCPFL